MSSEQVWYDLCTRAFDNDPIANDFVLFVESCKLPKQDSFVWRTKEAEYQHYFRLLGCKDSLEGFWLSSAELAHWMDIKRQARTDWQTRLQLELKARLDQTLGEEQPLELSSSERLARVKRFVAEGDLGSVPLITGLKGFLSYQWAHQDRLTEWSMTEYTLTQSGPELIQPYVHLLKSTMALELISTSEQDNLLWRMNPNLDNLDLLSILRILPGPLTATTSHYRQTDTLRFHKTTFYVWIYSIFSQLCHLF